MPIIDINDLQQVTNIDEDNSLMVFSHVNTNNGSVMSVSDFKEQIAEMGTDFHAHNLYRGKNLGTSFTETQSGHIKNGTFEDLYIGDYWVINGKNWRIGAIDPAYNCGDTKSTTHHVLIVPDTNLYNH